MKEALRDVGILLAIVATAWLLMHIPGSNDRRIERRRGEVYYSPRVSFHEAMDLAEFLVAYGVFRGPHTTVRLDRQGDLHQLTLIVDPELVKQPRIRLGLRGIADGICKAHFTGKKVTVRMADRELTDLGELVHQDQLNAPPSSDIDGRRGFPTTSLPSIPSIPRSRRG